MADISPPPLDYARPGPSGRREWVLPVVLLSIVALVGFGFLLLGGIAMRMVGPPSDPPMTQPAQTQPLQDGMEGMLPGVPESRPGAMSP